MARAPYVVGMGRDLPTGTVTFLFTDVEGSTRLLRELGEEEYARALVEHRRIVREVAAAHAGVEVDTQGDAFFVAFPTAPGALNAAATIGKAFSSGPIRVRVGIHTGTPLLSSEGYVGHDVHRAARIAAAGHGGQVLVSASTAALVGLDGLCDLGEHRLKDLSAPERIYQLGDGEFPLLKSLHQTNLPIPATPFLGREKELGEVLGLISRADVRLLTLTGPGGTGKTRLGAQAAGAVAESYAHGVWWIPLAPLRDVALVVETAAQTIGAQDGLADHIADKSMLLLFDNFEQVIDSASDLANLLASCPNLNLLVTSREPLHVTGEQEYAVPPFVHEEGVGFFLARARAVDPKFEADAAVSEICRRLDDLPLALELAAARVKALSSQQILERLERRLPLLTGGARDLPERQRTLRATIEWSYDLLTVEEQQLFARLAVFRAGCTLDAAEKVAEADVDKLQSLVDKSLLRRADDRFWMLETIREYAAQRLGETESEEERWRHAQYFLALAEEAEPHLLEHGAAADLVSGRKAWIEPLELELDNVRAALDWLEEKREGQLAQRLAGALSEFWCGANRVPEGRRRLESALALDETATPARARALIGAGHMARDAGDPAAARTRAEAALALHRQFGNQWAAAHALLWLGEAVADEGDYRRAQQLFEECASGFAAVGDEYFELMARRLTAWIHYELGDRDKAQALHEANLERARARGYLRVEATTLGALASYAIEDRRVDDATRLARKALSLYRQIGSPRGVTTELCRCAGALAIAGKPDLAAQLLACSEALHEEKGLGILPYLAAENQLTVALLREQLDDAALSDAWERGRALSIEEAVSLALDALA